ncbi:bud site selection protein [Coemansia sp. RSA 989]|nr:bud site selection protein [Coemansia sp. RSA 1086]KAJ1747084.1 bud site selection protein [Coemansia sp. RSA 1821]KAJ1861076.1 bud site selection protein [Coemansia sp. RSA 989]KAJ1869126.1 bud site selection protein [Coemansia sp. RSA 990]KAJ2667730.1 bud site selection protein [Coemansia sp. RSA 1085]
MSYNDCLQDVPDIFENEIGEALAMRTESLGLIREMGPPDLCHIVKIHSNNRNEPDIGSYHHALGVDTSSSASIAAYINSLQYSLNDKPGWFGSGNNWKIASGTYCTYNAFSKVDLRVQIKIPGGVDAYAITMQGERKEVTDELWKECHVSAILRAILYSDPAEYSVTGLRRLTLATNLREEAHLVEALMEQFWNGWKLGSNAETQVASHSRNFLVDGLMMYFAGQGRFIDCAAEVLSPLAYAPVGGQQQQPPDSRSSLDFKGIDPEVAALLAEAYVDGDEEVKAVQVMHQALKAKPSCYPMLSTQAEFLRLKKQYSAARKIALMAVKYAPSEFHAWAELTKVYIDDNDFSNALLTLNTCPMYTYVDRDYPRVPTPRRINYPVKSEILAEYSLGDNFTNGNYGPVPMNPRPSTDSDAPGVAEEAAQNETSFILRLAAPTLKGTFAHAYKLLTGIVSTIGWDELLQLRSSVFVMEEEYRNSVGPSVAVDDEEDDEDDSIPLSALKECKKAGSENQQSANGKAEITTSEAQTPEIQPDEGTKTGTADSAQGDDQASESNEIKKEAKPEETQDEPEEEDQSNKNESQSAKPKSKKKKKNRGKKSNVQEVKSQEAESAEPTEQPQDKGPEASKEPTNGPDTEQTKTSIAELGDQMDEVSLSDKDKPVAELTAPQIAARETKKQAEEQHPEQDSHLEAQTSKEQDVPHVRKRLCERWLDNLIMILFDDLRTYTNWRTKMHNMRAAGQQVVHQFTQAEWEALGDLALRLHRPSEAREAFESALRIRFSAKAWRRLLELHTGKYAAIQAEEVKRHDSVVPPLPLTSTDSLMMALDAAVWLAVYNDRWYNSMTYPNPLCNHIIKLVNIHGLSKVHNSLISMNLKPAVFGMIKRHLEIAEKFDVTGAKW